MNDDKKSVQHEHVIEEIEAKQRNTIWPDTLMNGRSVDEFLWKGSPDAPLVQRIGAWIFGIAFMLVGAVMMGVYLQQSPDRQSIAEVVLAVVFFGGGLKVFLNGFRRRKKREQKFQ